MVKEACCLLGTLFSSCHQQGFPEHKLLLLEEMERLSSKQEV